MTYKDYEIEIFFGPSPDTVEWVVSLGGVEIASGQSKPTQESIERLAKGAGQVDAMAWIDEEINK